MHIAHQSNYVTSECKGVGLIYGGETIVQDVEELYPLISHSREPKN